MGRNGGEVTQAAWDGRSPRGVLGQEWLTKVIEISFNPFPKNLKVAKSSPISKRVFFR
jgi:hypothetical protein